MQHEAGVRATPVRWLIVQILASEAPLSLVDLVRAFRLRLPRLKPTNVRQAASMLAAAGIVEVTVQANGSFCRLSATQLPKA
jgi:Fe2+ or Zn2+ uptake regulation protein